LFYAEGIRHPEELSLARILSADELKRNQGVSATRRSRPASVRPRSRSSGGHQQFTSTASILDSVRGSSLQLGSPSGRTPSMFTSRVRLINLDTRLWTIYRPFVCLLDCGRGMTHGRSTDRSGKHSHIAADLWGATVSVWEGANVRKTTALVQLYMLFSEMGSPRPYIR